MLLKDIRDDQNFFLGLFLILGISTRDWTLRPELIGVAIATGIFQAAYTREDRKFAFLEYAWDMGSCNPCLAFCK